MNIALHQREYHKKEKRNETKEFIETLPRCSDALYNLYIYIYIQIERGSSFRSSFMITFEYICIFLKIPFDLYFIRFIGPRSVFYFKSAE